MQLFASDEGGNLTQFDIETARLVKNFGKVHEGGINSMALTKNNEFLFTADKYGNLKQFSVPDSTLVNDLPKIHKAIIYSIGKFQCNLKSLVTTWDDEFLFTSDSDGVLKQWYVNEKRVTYMKKGKKIIQAQYSTPRKAKKNKT
jgi:WD40 repeat protein